MKSKVKHQLSDRPINPEHYIYLVRFIANRYIRQCPTNVELGDLCSAGIIGLIDAISKYDNTRGNAFITYAYKRILGAMRDEVRKIRGLPRYKKEPIFRVQYVPFNDFLIANADYSDMLCKLENVEVLRKNCKNITKKEMEILRFYFFCGMYRSEIAEIYDVSESRIGQILKKTIAKIRRNHAKNRRNP